MPVGSNIGIHTQIHEIDERNNKLNQNKYEKRKKKLNEECTMLKP